MATEVKAMIPVLRPIIADDEENAVSEVLRSGWWGMGPMCEKFERELESLYQYQHAVTVNSCTAALHLALRSHGIGPVDQVIVPALTFISTALAVVYCRATPIFADVDPKTLCLDWDDVERKRTPATAAVISVDYAGHPAPPPISFMGPALIQDAAHSCGGLGYGDSVCLSFHPVKNCATGDGGAILTRDFERAERLKALRWCGVDKSTWQRSGKRYSWDYDIAEVGYKYHWNDIQAAIGFEQLIHIRELNGRRQAIAFAYNDQLAGLSQHIELPAGHPLHTWHLYTIRVDPARRDALIDHLTKKDINVSVHYKPLTYYPMFKSPRPGYSIETPPVTEREWRRLISLPIHAGLTPEDQARVINAIWEFYA